MNALAFAKVLPSILGGRRAEGYLQMPLLRDEDGAYDIDGLCAEYKVGKTKIYEVLNSGELAARKCGARTLISKRDARVWFDSLPIYRPGAGEDKGAASAAASNEATGSAKPKSPDCPPVAAEAADNDDDEDEGEGDEPDAAA